MSALPGFEPPHLERYLREWAADQREREAWKDKDESTYRFRAKVLEHALLSLRERAAVGSVAAIVAAATAWRNEKLRIQDFYAPRGHFLEDAEDAIFVAVNTHEQAVSLPTPTVYDVYGSAGATDDPEPEVVGPPIDEAATKEWLARMADAENGCNVSVGGLIVSPRNEGAHPESPEQTIRRMRGGDPSHQELMAAFARGRRDGYVLCQNELQRLATTWLQAGSSIYPIQECIDALSRVQPPCEQEPTQ